MTKEPPDYSFCLICILLVLIGTAMVLGVGVKTLADIRDRLPPSVEHR